MHSSMWDVQAHRMSCIALGSGVGWNASRDLPALDPEYDAGNTTGSGVPHGYERLSIYDGAHPEDNYHHWFSHEMPGHTAEEGWPTLNYNGWEGAPYAFDEHLHPTAWVGQQAVDYISSVKTDAKWFLKVSFHRPHSPYDPPARVLNSTRASDLPEVMLALDGWDHVFRGGPTDPPGCGPSDKSAWCGLMPAVGQELGRRAYYANVAFIDEYVGKILAALTSRKLLENTLIIWTADHGDGQADHYHWRKGFPYQFSSNVPLLMRWPEAFGPTATPRGTVISELVTELRDVFPTMLDAAGGLGAMPPGHELTGTSLLCLLQDSSGATCDHTTPGELPTAAGTTPGAAGKRIKGWRPWLDLEHSTQYNNTNHWSALTDGKMKYIFNACDNCGAVLPREQLFNLTADDGERVDLHADAEYDAELAKWRGRMVAQFEAEGRGSEWVQGGVLQLRPPQLYGPNYPRSEPPSPPPHPPGLSECWNDTVAAGDGVDLQPTQGRTKNPKICQVCLLLSHSTLQRVCCCVA